MKLRGHPEELFSVFSTPLTRKAIEHGKGELMKVECKTISSGGILLDLRKVE